MSNDLVHLWCGLFLLTATVTYICWRRVRVIFIQEELFSVRDRLWDMANSLGLFDDPAYLQERNRLNTIIRVVNVLNMPVVLSSLASRNNDPKVSPLQSDNAKLQAEIEVARSRAGEIVVKYIVFYRPVGMITLLAFATIGAIRDSVTKWLLNSGPENLYSDERALMQRKHTLREQWTF